jgi:hypothetical protein
LLEVEHKQVCQCRSLLGRFEIRQNGSENTSTTSDAGLTTRIAVDRYGVSGSLGSNRNFERSWTISFAIKARTLAGERGTTHEYVLTPRGATIRTLLFERDVVLDYRQYRRARKQFERSRAEFIDAVDTDTAYLGDDEVNEKNLKTLLDRKAFSELVEDADDS